MDLDQDSELEDTLESREATGQEEEKREKHLSVPQSAPERASSLSSSKCYKLWNNREVHDWLVEKVCPEAKFKEQFELYARNFLENEVLGDQLQFLTREDLEQDLKIKSLMHRKWILQAIQQLIGYQQKAVMSRQPTGASCLKCNNPVDVLDQVQYEDSFYHFDCFTCDLCQRNLGGLLYAKGRESSDGLQRKYCTLCVQHLPA